MTSSTFTLLDGYQETSSDTNHLDVRIRNLLQRTGVRPGENRLDVSVERISSEWGLRAVTVLPGSRVFASERGPAEVEVAYANIRGIDEMQGSRVVIIDFSAANNGERVAHGARLEVISDVGRMRTRGAFLGDLSPGTSVAGTLFVQLPQQAPSKVVVFSNYGSPVLGVPLALVDEQAQAQRTLPVLGLIVGSMLVVGALTILARDRCRTRHDGDL